MSPVAHIANASAKTTKKITKKMLSRTRILAAASNLMREHGYSGAGLQTIMRSAGLTVGGFYAHFQSKEMLFAQVITASFKQIRDRYNPWQQGKTGRQWLTALIEDYLSLRHRNDIAGGCPMPALISELPRAGALARAEFEREFLVSIGRFRDRLTEMGSLAVSSEDAQHRAQVILALLVGGLSIARAVKDEALAAQILESCRKAALGFVTESGENHGIRN